jgi:Mrp family chromosome partitioning ATPase
VAITSPTAGCGKSSIATNLALSLSHQREIRTVLIDLDLRRPQISRLLGISSPNTFARYLREEVAIEQAFIRYRDNVLISTNDKPVKFAAELLQSEGASRVIQDMRRRLSPTVIIYDMPPMLANDDVKAFLPNVDCAVLAAAAETTTQREIDVCERELSRQINVVGIVLNKCRYMPDKYGY